MMDFREHESRSPWNWLGIHWFKGLVSFFNRVGIGTDAPTQSGQTNASPVLNLHSASAGSYPAVVLTTAETAINSVPGLVVFGAPNTAGSEKRACIIQAANAADAASDITASFYIYTTIGGTIGIRLTIKADGTLNIAGVGEHTDNADALSAGHVAGDVYRTGDALKIVH